MNLFTWQMIGGKEAGGGGGVGYKMDGGAI
jgi:hypothetical protein